jgi:hypothetical protein
MERQRINAALFAALLAIFWFGLMPVNAHAQAFID